MLSDSIIVIPLTKGQSTIIDSADSDLASLKWYAQKHHTGKCYAVRRIRTPNGKVTILMHRLILERKLGRKLEKGELPDHENRNSLDNTRGNLRIATPSQNVFNSNLPKDNTSGTKGVYWDKQTKQWRACIGVKRKSVHLGRFDKIEDAIKARHDAELEYFGEFAPRD